MLGWIHAAATTDDGVLGAEKDDVVFYTERPESAILLAATRDAPPLRLQQDRVALPGGQLWLGSDASATRTQGGGVRLGDALVATRTGVLHAGETVSSAAFVVRETDGDAEVESVNGELLVMRTVLQNEVEGALMLERIGDPAAAGGRHWFLDFVSLDEQQGILVARVQSRSAAEFGPAASPGDRVVVKNLAQLSSDQLITDLVETGGLLSVVEAAGTLPVGALVLGRSTNADGENQRTGYVEPGGTFAWLNEAVTAPLNFVAPVNVSPTPARFRAWLDAARYDVVTGELVIRGAAVADSSGIRVRVAALEDAPVACQIAEGTAVAAAAARLNVTLSAPDGARATLGVGPGTHALIANVAADADGSVADPRPGEAGTTTVVGYEVVGPRAETNPAFEFSSSVNMSSVWTTAPFDAEIVVRWVDGVEQSTYAFAGDDVTLYRQAFVDPESVTAVGPAPRQTELLRADVEALYFADGTCRFVATTEVDATRVESVTAKVSGGPDGGFVKTLAVDDDPVVALDINLGGQVGQLDLYAGATAVEARFREAWRRQALVYKIFDAAPADREETVTVEPRENVFVVGALTADQDGVLRVPRVTPAFAAQAAEVVLDDDTVVASTEVVGGQLVVPLGPGVGGEVTLYASESREPEVGVVSFDASATALFQSVSVAGETTVFPSAGTPYDLVVPWTAGDPLSASCTLSYRYKVSLETDGGAPAPGIRTVENGEAVLLATGVSRLAVSSGTLTSDSTQVAFAESPESLMYEGLLSTSVDAELANTVGALVATADLRPRTSAASLLLTVSRPRVAAEITMDETRAGPTLECPAPLPALGGGRGVTYYGDDGRLTTRSSSDSGLAVYGRAEIAEASGSATVWVVRDTQLEAGDLSGLVASVSGNAARSEIVLSDVADVVAVFHAGDLPIRVPSEPAHVVVDGSVSTGWTFDPGSGTLTPPGGVGEMGTVLTVHGPFQSDGVGNSLAELPAFVESAAASVGGLSLLRLSVKDAASWRLLPEGVDDPTAHRVFRTETGVVAVTPGQPAPSGALDAVALHPYERIERLATLQRVGPSLYARSVKERAFSYDVEDVSEGIKSIQLPGLADDGATWAADAADGLLTLQNPTVAFGGQGVGLYVVGARIAGNLAERGRIRGLNACETLVVGSEYTPAPGAVATVAGNLVCRGELGVTSSLTEFTLASAADKPELLMRANGVLVGRLGPAKEDQVSDPRLSFCPVAGALTSGGHAGKLVAFDGTFQSLAADGQLVRGVAAADDPYAVPVVRLSQSTADAVVGVVAGEPVASATLSAGVFQTVYQEFPGGSRTPVRRAGFVRVWVTDEGDGPLERGDILEAGPHGYARRQTGNGVTSTSVARCLAGCAFDPNGAPVPAQSFVGGEWIDDPQGAQEVSYEVRYIDAGGDERTAAEFDAAGGASAGWRTCALVPAALL